MGNKDDCSPETSAATAFGVLTSALEYAREHLPEFVEELEKRQLVAAKRLVDLDPPHSLSYIDSEGEERCLTCDKWLERGYYTIEDHQRAV